MIDEPRLRDGLARLLTATEDNIRHRCDDDSSVNQPLQERYESTRKGGRTGLTFSVWREGEITQAGVAWLLACVLVRFLEDNDLIGDVISPDRRGAPRQHRRGGRTGTVPTHMATTASTCSESTGLLHAARQPQPSLGRAPRPLKSMARSTKRCVRNTTSSIPAWMPWPVCWAELIGICDVAMLIRNVSLDWDEVTRTADEWRANRPLAIAVYARSRGSRHVEETHVNLRRRGQSG